jgi:DNA-binding NarL/FixJ family response regulator
MVGASNANGTHSTVLKYRRASGNQVSGVADQPEIADRKVVPPSLLIVSDIRFLREGLAEVLMREREFQIAGAAHDLAEAIQMTDAAAPDIILIDTALPDGPDAAGQLRERAPRARLIALAIVETEAEIIAWATAGICGYVPRGAGLSELVGVLKAIVRGEQMCPSRIAGGLLHWIASRPHAPKTQSPAPKLPALTAREQQVVALIGAGLSNKEIARRLNIGLATTKSHVHNLLGKLELARRSQVAGWLHDRRAVHGQPG